MSKKRQNQAFKYTQYSCNTIHCLSKNIYSPVSKIHNSLEWQRLPREDFEEVSLYAQPPKTTSRSPLVGEGPRSMLWKIVRGPLRRLVDDLHPPTNIHIHVHTHKQWHMCETKQISVDKVHTLKPWQKYHWFHVHQPPNTGPTSDKNTTSKLVLWSVIHLLDTSISGCKRQTETHGTWQKYREIHTSGSALCAQRKAVQRRVHSELREWA